MVLLGAGLVSASGEKVESWGTWGVLHAHAHHYVAGTCASLCRWRRFCKLDHVSVTLLILRVASHACGHSQVGRLPAPSGFAPTPSLPKPGAAIPSAVIQQDGWMARGAQILCHLQTQRLHTHAQLGRPLRSHVSASQSPGVALLGVSARTWVSIRRGRRCARLCCAMPH